MAIAQKKHIFSFIHLLPTEEDKNEDNSLNTFRSKTPYTTVKIPLSTLMGMPF